MTAHLHPPIPPQTHLPPALIKRNPRKPKDPQPLPLLTLSQRKTETEGPPTPVQSPSPNPIKESEGPQSLTPQLPHQAKTEETEGPPNPHPALLTESLGIPTTSFRRSPTPAPHSSPPESIAQPCFFLPVAALAVCEDRLPNRPLQTASFISGTPIRHTGTPIRRIQRPWRNSQPAARSTASHFRPTPSSSIHPSTSTLKEYHDCHGR